MSARISYEIDTAAVDVAAFTRDVMAIPAPPYSQTPTLEGLEYLQEIVSAVEALIARGDALVDRLFTITADLSGFVATDETGFHAGTSAEKQTILDGLITTVRSHVADLRLLYAGYVAAADVVARDLEWALANEAAGISAVAPPWRSVTMPASRMPAWAIRNRLALERKTRVALRLV